MLRTQDRCTPDFDVLSGYLPRGMLPPAGMLVARGIKQQPVAVASCLRRGVGCIGPLGHKIRQPAPRADNPTRPAPHTEVEGSLRLHDGGFYRLSCAL